jgi:8-amino-7-oxononanoate synthase
MYENELLALKKRNIFRKREIWEKKKDFASNDYLSLGCNKKILKKACKRLKNTSCFAPRASLLVNGYTSLHKEFEEMLANRNGFEAGILAGSGFLANISLLEALVRKGDVLFLDEEFHASGILASKLVEKKIFFKHNEPQDLEDKLKKTKHKRAIIAVEGIYSMSGDILKKEFFEIADRFKAVLIIDEAHSSGVVGNKLLGVLDEYCILPKPNYIKMGTLGKAYGSYGAYILASREIISFLENRAKPIIFSTALSLCDTALAMESFLEIEKNLEKFKKKIEKRKKILSSFLEKKNYSLIATVFAKNSLKALETKKKLIEKGFIVGAIRPPAVKKALIRVTARVGEKCKDLKRVLKYIDGI